MSRSPINVLVYPYRVGDGGFEYALFRRSDAGYWQGVSGGAEGDESPLQAAQRETWEETGITPDAPFLPLDTVIPVPVTEYKDSYLWGEHIYVIPQYCFGVLAQDKQIVLSREHTDYQWLQYEEARSLLKYDGCKTALWELDRRLKRSDNRPEHTHCPGKP